MPTSSPVDPELTPTSALSLLDLRRELIRRAVALAAQARACRRRGEFERARKLAERSAQLNEVAERMRTTNS